MIAAASPDPTAFVLPVLQAVFWLVGGIGATLGCLVAARKLREPPQLPVAISPQPLVVAPAKEVVNEQELHQVHGRISRERSEIDKELLSIRADQRELREKLDGEIKDLNGRIDNIPQRTISLLRETKGLI